MTKIRHYHFASQDAPIFGKFTKSQLIIILSVSLFPFLWAFYNIKTANSIVLIIISSMLFIISLVGGYIITSLKIDGRPLVKYLIDKRRIKVKKSAKRLKVEPADIENMIEEIVK